MTVGVDPDVYGLTGVDDFPHALFASGAQRLFAGTSINPLDASATQPGTPDHIIGAITRIKDPSRRLAGIYDLSWSSGWGTAGRFGLGVVLADERDWGNGLGMDAMIALLRHAFYSQNARTFVMSAGVHNKNTVQILATGSIRPEALCVDAIGDDRALCELVLGAMSSGDFRIAGYRPPDASDSLWRSIAAASLAEVSG
ncbi:N-acetyltransferase [Rhodococcus sp. ABRD24]|uniref:GNAT family protein n=1 Tax=Rhodococcus sp. ABRD24 TaxID=2507582 RepID=UPI0010403F1F|nr:GNAT family protein [Rhodococcus sp. ABRD24]QBJ98002.1 N-acetyltransferase [Rhodococcus sp. ABRD24]